MINSQEYLESAVPGEFMMNWRTNYLCNFRCSYCFYDEKVLSKKIPLESLPEPAQIAGFFMKTQKKWRIHMTGGEPFLYPGFVTLCRELTAENRISLNTNLSTGNVFEFADTINPKKVYAIAAALHIEEREKRPGALDDFVKKMKYLQDKGFDARVEYVAHPLLLSRMDKDIGYLREQGVRLVNVKLFQGVYAGKMYPVGYSRQERLRLERSIIDGREIALFDGKDTFWALPCAAGAQVFSMDDSGEVFRCSTSWKSHGNLFKGTFILRDRPAPCAFWRCRCPYEGLMYVCGKSRNCAGALGELFLECRGVFMDKKRIGEYVRAKLSRLGKMVRGN